LPDHLPYCSIDELFPALFVALLNCCVLFFSPFSPIIVYYCSILAYYSGSIDELPLLFLSRYLIVVHICSPPILCQETLRIVSPPTNPLLKHLVALLKGSLLLNCALLLVFFCQGFPNPCAMAQFSKTPACSPPHYSTYGVLHFTRGFIGLFATFCSIVVRSVVG
jgi:hypothetical protein